MNTMLSLRIAAFSAVLFTGSLTAQYFYIPDNAPAAGTCNVIPFGTTKPSSWENQKYQTIVPLSEITTGTITGLAFAACGSQTRTMDSIIVTMGQNPSGALVTNFAANLVNNVAVVLNRSSLFTYDCGAGDSWTDLELDTGYTVLPGQGDLVIDLEIVGNDRIAGGGTGFHRWTAGSTRRLQSTNWPTGFPPATGSLDTAPAKMRICFGTYHGVPDLDPTTGTNGNSIPLGSYAADMRYQTIVTPADLGNTASMINAIAFSAHTASAALSRTYTLLEIRLAHSTSSVLDPTFANNLQSPPGGALVYSATNVTIDWLMGTWKNINLQSAFPYNGTDHLIVEITTNGNTGAGSTFHWRGTRPRLYATGIGPLTGTLNTGGLKMRICTSCRNARVGYRGVGCGPGLNIRAGLPVIGTNVPFSLYNGPAGGPGFILLGLDAGVPYPVDLSGIGMSNCFLYQGILAVIPTAFAGGTTPAVFFSIPNNPNFCVFTLYAQGGAIWPGANPAGIVLSNQAVCGVGV